MRVPSLGSVLRRVFQALGVLALLASNAWAGSAHPNLVAWYRMEGNALDSSGNGNHGTWDGTEAYDSAPFGTGMDFDGSTREYIDVAGVAATVNSNSDFSISLWVNGTAADANVAHGIFRAASFSGQGTGGIGLQLNGLQTTFGPIPAGRITFAMREDAAAYVSTVAAAHGAWTHIVAVHDAGTMRLYRHGTLQGEEPRMSVSASTYAFVGSQRVTGASADFTCLIDDVRIYNAALSPSDIRRVMQGMQPLHRY